MLCFLNQYISLLTYHDSLYKCKVFLRKMTNKKSPPSKVQPSSNIKTKYPFRKLVFSPIQKNIMIAKAYLLLI